MNSLFVMRVMVYDKFIFMHVTKELGEYVFLFFRRSVRQFILQILCACGDGGCICVSMFREMIVSLWECFYKRVCFSSYIRF